VCQDALKFMRHSCRSTLSTDDINSALRLRGIELVSLSLSLSLSLSDVPPTV
jgi:hypothetical protein